MMHLNAFILGVGHHEAAWRLPESDPRAPMSLAHYQGIAALAELAKFDAVFIADVPALSVEPGRRPPESPSPALLLAALAASTERIGLIGTASTTYNDPYTLAREMATLDHLSGGRAAWNIVTTASEAAAANYGFDAQPAHAERYERAEEFLSVVLRLWESWEPDAVVADKESGMYADADRIRPIDHVGEHFRVRGPLNISRTPQGRPVLVQAGASATGMGFASMYGEAIFCAHQSEEAARVFYDDLKGRVRANGRNPDHVKILPGIVPIVGSTEDEAVRMREQLDDLMVDTYAHRQLANAVGLPIEELPLDQPLPSSIRSVDEVQGHKGRYAMTVDMARSEQLTVGQVLRRLAGGRGHAVTCGTPEKVADFMEHWYRNGAADGFNVMAPYLPGGLAAFVEQVVPILQERGLFRRDYEGQTLRQHLGLPDL